MRFRQERAYLVIYENESSVIYQKKLNMSCIKCSLENYLKEYEIPYTFLIEILFR